MINRQFKRGVSPEARAVVAQGETIITAKQVRALVITAKKAYEHQGSLGLIGPGETFDAWRKTVLIDISPYPTICSFRLIKQRDYRRINGHFRALGGLKADASPETNDEARRARWRLNRELEDLADVFGGKAEAERYAAAIAWDQCKRPLDQLEAEEAWRIIFTLRKRAKAKKKVW